MKRAVLFLGTLFGAIGPGNYALFLNKSERRGAAQIKGVDVYYVTELLDKLKVFIERHKATTQQRYDSETLRLLAATQNTRTTSDKKLLESTVEKIEEARMESQHADDHMRSFYYTLKSILGAKSTAPTCQYLICAKDEVCHVTNGIAACGCKPHYVHDGFVCKPVAFFTTSYFSAQPLFKHVNWAEPLARVADIDLIPFSRDHVAVAYRKMTDRDRGFLLFGKTSADGVTWGQPVPFSGKLAAYSPAISVLGNGNVMIAFRDASRSGTGYVVSGRINSTDAMDAALGAPHAVSRFQAQKMVLMPLGSSNIVCLYSDRSFGNIQQAYGGAILMQVASGSFSIMGRYRFADMPVARLAATQLTPSSLVIAYRGMQVDASPGATQSPELSATWMGMEDGELVIDPHPLVLEPNQKDMWARDISLVSENVLAYSYQSGMEKKTKVALIHVDPNTHTLKTAGEPTVIAEGDTKYVQGISLPAAASEPHTFTYYQHPKSKGEASACRIDPSGQLSHCNKIEWADTELESVRGGRLGNGRLLFVFSDLSGEPFYQLLGSA